MFENVSLKHQSIASVCHAKSYNFFTENDVGFCLSDTLSTEKLRVQKFNPTSSQWLV